MKWIKGSMLVALRREFVDFMLTDPKAVELLSILRSERHLKKVQDELFFSTLAHHPQWGAPGACMQMSTATTGPRDPRFAYLVRYVNWDEKNCPSGFVRHYLCILGVRDVPLLTRRSELFANKFLDTFQPLAYECMQYWLVGRIRDEQRRRRLAPDWNTRVYAQLHCSRNHV